MILRTQAPDVHIVDFAHAWNLEHRLGHLRKLHTLGQAFEQDIGGVNDDPNRGPEDHARNHKSQNRVDDGVARAANDQGARDDSYV